MASLVFLVYDFPPAMYKRVKDIALQCVTHRQHVYTYSAESDSVLSLGHLNM